MTRKRVSGRRLAELLNVSPSWVSYRITGVTPIDLNDLERIAAVLEVAVADLLPPGILQRRPRPTDGQTTAAKFALTERRLDRTEQITRVPAPTATRPPDNRPAGGSARVASAPNLRRPALIRSDRRPLAA